MLKRRTVLCALVLVILAATALLLTHDLRSKPTLMWKGEPAQYWIGRLNFFDLEGASASAEEFLFAAGPQVVPELIRGLSMPDNWLTDCRSWLYFKLGKWQRHFQMPTKPAE